MSENIGVEVIPKNPKPYETTTINLSSYAFDLNKSMIVWQRGSNIILSGYGEKSYSFQTSGPDVPIIFDIKITPTGSQTINKRIAIVPSDLDLLWEAVGSYVPPFYKGKAMPTQEDTIRVVAIPNSTYIKSGVGEMSYTWKLNNDTVLDSSGYNKNSYTFTNSVLNDIENISVTISSLDGRYATERNIDIEIKNPFVLFYKKTPELGTLYNEGFKKETTISQGETTIVAEPYFISSKNQEYDFDYKWTLNDEKIETPLKKTEITFRPSSMGGYSEIGFSMESITRLFQNVSGLIKINL